MESYLTYPEYTYYWRKASDLGQKSQVTKTPDAASLRLRESHAIKRYRAP
jgi:hypothetical protein